MQYFDAINYYNIVPSNQSNHGSGNRYSSPFGKQSNNSQNKNLSSEQLKTIVEILKEASQEDNNSKNNSKQAWGVNEFIASMKGKIASNFTHAQHIMPKD